MTATPAPESTPAGGGLAKASTKEHTVVNSINPLYSNLKDAGRAIGAAQGFYGKSGGWIYRVDANGKERTVGQGWDTVAHRAGVYYDKDAGKYRVPAVVIERWGTPAAAAAKTINGTEVRERREATGLSRRELIAFLDSKGFTGWTQSSLADLERTGRELDALASAEFFRAFEEAVAAGNGAGELTLPAERLDKAVARAATRYAERDGFISDDDLLDIANDLTPGFEYPEDDYDAEIPAEIVAARDELLEALYVALTPAPEAPNFFTPEAATGRGSVVCDNSRTWVAVRQTPAFAVALDIARQERRSSIKLDQAREKLALAAGLVDQDDAAENFSTAHRFFRNDNNVLWGAARMLAAMVDNDDELGALQVLRDELDRQDAGQPAAR